MSMIDPKGSRDASHVMALIREHRAQKAMLSAVVLPLLRSVRAVPQVSGERREQVPEIRKNPNAR
jgi:hypothetical protein